VEDSRAEVFSALLKLNGDGRELRNSLAPPIIIAHPSGTLWLSFPNFTTCRLDDALATFSTSTALFFSLTSPVFNIL
jgi:hypothetical protein